MDFLGFLGFKIPQKESTVILFDVEVKMKSFSLHCVGLSQLVTQLVLLDYN